MSTATAPPTDVAFARALRGAALSGGAAAIANLTVWAVARATDIELLIPSTPGGTPDTALGVVPVVLATLVPMLIGGLLYAGVTRWSSRPHRLWVAIVAVATILSFGPILALGADAGVVVALGSMHVLTGVAAAVLLPRTVRADR